VRLLLLAVLLSLAGLWTLACGGGGDSGPEAPGDSQTADSAEDGDSNSDEETPAGDDGEQDEGDGEDEEQPSSDSGQCRVQISGDLEIQGTSPGGPSAFGTDYYYSDDEMREILEQFARAADPDLSDAEVEAQVDEDMQSDPRLFLIILNCVNDDYSISLLPAGDSRYADIPFGPGEYEIAAGGVLGGDAAPGTFGVLMTVGEGLYEVSEPGQLRIERWDEEGIAGTFAFNAEEILTEETPKSLSVTGAFDFDCVAGSRCED
jgi:hypothetical protein